MYGAELANRTSPMNATRKMATPNMTAMYPNGLPPQMPGVPGQYNVSQTAMNAYAATQPSANPIKNNAGVPMAPAASANNTGGNGATQAPTDPLANLPGQTNYQDMYGSSPQLPGLNLGALSGAFTPPGAPNVPDYLGQMGNLFNNFQGMDLGANLGNLGDMFQGYNELANQRGPQIPVEDVISQQMQDRMLNSAIGANRAQRDTSMRDATNQLGARGFTSESPALQATGNRLGLNEAIANTQARTDIPIQAARQNADYRLGAMQANQGQRSQDVQNFIGLENAKTGRISPLLQALVGLV